MFSLFGFKVRIHPSFFLMAAILGMPRGFSPAEVAQTLVWVVVVTVSILIHELGHAFAARSMGGTASIELYALGGMARQRHQSKLTHGQRAWISFAGPLAGLTLGALVFLLGRVEVVATNDVLRDVQRQLLWVNLGWGVLNLLPMLPLDGGHILHAGLDAVTGGKGTRAAHIISVTVGVACTALALYAQLYWAAFIAGWCTLSTIRGLRQRGQEQHDHLLREEYEQVVGQNQDGGPETLARLQSLLIRAQSDRLRARIIESVAWLHLCEGRDEQAVRVLSSMPGDRGPSDTLQGALLYNQGRLKDAIPSLRRALQRQSSDTETWEWGLNALCEAYLTTGQPGEAMKLLDAEAPKLDSAELLSRLDLRLFEAGHFEQAAEVGQMAFEKSGHPVNAYNTACSHARIDGSEAAAMDWLNRAVDAGWEDWVQLDGDSDLDGLRKLPEFQALRARISQEQK